MITNILLLIIVGHLILGFGWLVYKLSPRKDYETIDNNLD